MNLLAIGNPPRANAKHPDECPDEYRVWEDARLLPAVHAAYHAIDEHATLPAGPDGGWDVALLFNSAWRIDARPLLRNLRQANRNVKVALWVFDFGKQSRIAQNKAVAEHVDYFFYTDGHSDWNVRRPGGRLNQGVPSSWQHFSAERTHEADFVYTGQAYKHRLEIIQQLAALNTIVWHNNGPECEPIPNVRFAPAVYDRQLFEACCRARFCLVPSYKAGLANYWSNRIYLAAATGVPCFVEEIDGLDAEFVANRDVITFRRETLTEQVAHYKSNYPAAERIGRRGRELVFDKHTYRHRLETMLTRMG